MNLTVADRMHLLAVLPDKGDIITLMTLRALKRKLFFSDEERAAMNLRNIGDRWVWKEDAPDAEIPITDAERIIIARQLRDLSDRKELNLACIDLWRLFCEWPAAESAT